MLDLPHVYQKPSFEALLSALESLHLQPPLWNHRPEKQDEEGESLAAQRKGESTRYIASIISSPLGWLTDEEREVLWDTAAKRMSERCGRTAMGEMTRTWPLEMEDGTMVNLAIREPALTGDSLGFKTWGSSYVFARHLEKLGGTALVEILGTRRRTKGAEVKEERELEDIRVVELGSGTGLLGLAAAATWRVRVCLSDLPDITANLRRNVDENRAVVEQRGGELDVGVLTWGGDVDEDLFGRENQFEIVLAADPLYDDEHPALLAATIGQHLALGTESRAVVMVPQRDATTVGLLGAFKQAMFDLGEPLVCVEEDELAGQDDWGDDEGGHVRCWLGVFSRSR